MIQINSFVRQMTYALCLAIMVAVQAVVPTNKALAISGDDFQPGHIIDDSIMQDAMSLSLDQVQSDLNDLLGSNGQMDSQFGTCDTNGNKVYVGTYKNVTYTANAGTSVSTTNNVLRKNLDANYPAPYTCLNGYIENPITHENNLQGRPHPQGGENAAQIITDAARQYTISPKVLLVLLQKESNRLLTDDWPWYTQFNSPMGYACPDSTGCNPSHAGFYNQVTGAAHQLRMYYDNPTQYNFVPAPILVSPSNPTGAVNIKYHPDPSSCGTESVIIQNEATAALYNYTPYVPNAAALANFSGSGDDCSAYGNRNFWLYFNAWFGYSVGCSTRTSPISDSVEFGKRNHVSLAQFIILTGSQLGCLEFHTWNSGETSWFNHTSSNQPAVDPRYSLIRYADLNGTGYQVPVLIGLSGTGSGMVEFHIWNPDLHSWSQHIISNLPTVDPTKFDIRFADLDGSGRDRAVLVGLKGTGSGMVEFHVWNPGMGTWSAHVASNQGAL